ncbi:hypothetical protein [Chitinophaga varians]|uniref:hypothetical protein n=1 Tax=Chitinophaga varians TaxID=2202339 RepID=UPI00165EF1DB|nr:hypothetical protein [Chitinophaga varians]MBC9912766.1 hypothetical protein [Chitinophaga varians]
MKNVNERFKRYFMSQETGRPLFVRGRLFSVFKNGDVNVPGDMLEAKFEIQNLADENTPTIYVGHLNLLHKGDGKWEVGYVMNQRFEPTEHFPTPKALKEIFLSVYDRAENRGHYEPPQNL